MSVSLIYYSSQDERLFNTHKLTHQRRLIHDTSYRTATWMRLRGARSSQLYTWSGSEVTRTNGIRIDLNRECGVNSCRCHDGRGDWFNGGYHRRLDREIGRNCGLEGLPLSSSPQQFCEILRKTIKLYR